MIASKSPPNPKYYEISQKIIQLIEKGTFKPGMKLPSETDIISRYNVSNTTARKILNEIQSAGWATRIKGKGTYVNKKSIARSANKILGFTKNMLEAGLVPSTKILNTEIISQDIQSSINGRLYKMKPPLLKIHRLRLANDIPMMVEVRYISLQFCPDIKKSKLDGSLYDIYEKTYHLKLNEVYQQLSSVMIDVGIKDFFNLPSAIPGIRVEGVTFCGKEMILEMEDSLYRGDKYHFFIRAVP